jgi:hypothetical protein
VLRKTAKKVGRIDRVAHLFGVISGFAVNDFNTLFDIPVKAVEVGSINVAVDACFD